MKPVVLEGSDSVIPMQLPYDSQYSTLSQNGDSDQ